MVAKKSCDDIEHALQCTIDYIVWGIRNAKDPKPYLRMALLLLRDSEIDPGFPEGWENG